MEKILIALTTDRDAHGDLRVLNVNVSLEKIQTTPEKFSHKLNVSEVRYSILTLGANCPISQYLTPAGAKISVEYEGKTYIGTIHSTTKNRIDGLSAMYGDAHAQGREKLRVGRKVEVTYDEEKSAVVISDLHSI